MYISSKILFHNSEPSNNNCHKLSYQILGLDCSGCIATLQNGIAKIPGILNTQVNFLSQELVVEFDITKHKSIDEFHKLISFTVHELGFAINTHNTPFNLVNTDEIPFLTKVHQRVIIHKELIISCTLLTICYLLSLFFPNQSNLLFSLTTLFLCYPIAKRQIVSIKSMHFFNIEMLMLVACIGAILIGEAMEASIVIVLFLVGEELESVAASRARANIKSLMSLSPPKAWLVQDEKLTEVNSSSLKPDDLVEVRAGANVPTDGIIVSGESHLTEAMLTGESTPQFKKAGDNIFAGTINNEGVLRFKVTTEYANNSVAKIIHLIERAENNKAPISRFLDKFSAKYTPCVFAIAVLVMLIPPLFFNAEFKTWIYRGLSVLLIGCPCALVLSVPAAITAAIASSAKKGILIKGGYVIELLAKIKNIAFDKTGTLTLGELSVTDYINLSENNSDNYLPIIAGIEASSNHPIAKAVTRWSLNKNIIPLQVENISHKVSHIIQAYFNNELYSIMSPTAFLKEQKLSLEHYNSLQNLLEAGKTILIFCKTVNAQLSPLVFLALQDSPKRDAQICIQNIKNLGLNPIMLTGDNKQTASILAASLGIKHYFAELFPEQKLQHISQFKTQGITAMVGDGINDSPALATADVGIAMGKSADITLETASAIIANNSLINIVNLISHAKRTLKIIKLNIVLALGLKAIFLITTLTGFTGLWLAVLADTGATVLVTLNSLRLLIYKNTKHLSILFVIILGLNYHSEAFCQRGFLPNYDEPRTPLSNWPGYFDTFIPEPGTYTASIFGPIDYGINKNTSIGVNFYNPLLWLGQIPLGYAKLRYKLVPLNNLSSAITLHAAIGYNPPPNKLFFSLFNFTNNTSYFLSNNTWITTHLTVFSTEVTTGTTTDTKYTSINAIFSLIGAGAEHFLTDTFGIKGMILTPISTTVNYDTSTANANINLNLLKTTGQNLIIIGILDFPFSENWLVSFGYLASAGGIISNIGSPYAEISAHW